MSRAIRIIVCLMVTLCTAIGFAQVASTKSPAAFVYVSSSPRNNTYEINGFEAADDGKLTPVTGSPFPANVQGMAVNGKFLFGTNGVYIYSFSIASDGALDQVASINAQKFNGGRCGGPTSLFLDHNGATLYDLDYYGNACANNTYQSFGIEPATGELSYLGASNPSVDFNVPLSFTGNNAFAYGSSCYHVNPDIFGFRRAEDGTMTVLDINPAMPAAQKGDGYCPYLAAADRSNHVATAVQEFDGATWKAVGLPQLATYTVDRAGALTTKSTFWNMPKTAVKYVSDIRMSPSGRLLAVAGMAGLQIFHFHGSDPITRFTGLLTVDPISQMFWDDDNHLYAISQTAGKLFVFTVTPTKASQASGSPYAIKNPQNIIVLPKQ
jgi:6-phosphogluconolactonase (cycloisomerase 2 family)